MKIAILYVCTGKYEIFWKDFYLSCEKNFIEGAQKQYFIFSDAEELHDEKTNPNIHKIFQQDIGWPFNTLKRYEMFSTVADRLKDFDYVFFFNANLLFIEKISAAEFLPQNQEKLVGAIHPGFYAKPKSTWPYELDAKSTAAIDINKAQHYYQGAINGGQTQAFIEAIKTLKTNIDTDLKQGVIALWHDESHWNAYLSAHQSEVKTLSPSYLYPENSNLPLEPKIFIRNKDQFGHLERMRNMKVGFSKKFILSVLKRIKTKSTYSAFKIYDALRFSKKGIFHLTNRPTNSGKKISVVITYFNRHETIHKTLYNILNDDRVGEILIVDDHSKEESFAYLQDFVKRLNNPKIKIIRNDANLGMFKNKIHSVSQAKNEWIVLLDSDNTLTKAYLDSIYAVQEWNTDTMYCPSFAWPLLNNEKIAGSIYTMESLKDLLVHDSMTLKQFLNLGNFFVNKNGFMSAIHEYVECIPYAADSIFINYMWLCRGNKLHIPKNCRYIHRVNPDSTWRAENMKSTVKFENIKNAILTLEKNPKKVI